MVQVENDKIFQFRIDPETEDHLTSIAAATERTKSAVIRWLINQEYASLLRDCQKVAGLAEISNPGA